MPVDQGGPNAACDSGSILPCIIGENRSGNSRGTRRASPGRDGERNGVRFQVLPGRRTRDRRVRWNGCRDLWGLVSYLLIFNIARFQTVLRERRQWLAGTAGQLANRHKRTRISLALILLRTAVNDPAVHAWGVSLPVRQRESGSAPETGEANVGCDFCQFTVQQRAPYSSEGRTTGPVMIGLAFRQQNRRTEFAAGN